MVDWFRFGFSLKTRMMRRDTVGRLYFCDLIVRGLFDRELLVRAASRRSGRLCVRRMFDRLFLRLLSNCLGSIKIARFPLGANVPGIRSGLGSLSLSCELFSV